MIDLGIVGIKDSHCQFAVDQALKTLASKLPAQAINLLMGTQVRIANGVTASGGVANAEEKNIVLDARKNELSLQQAEDFLVKEGSLDPGDWTKALPAQKDAPWGCLTYQLVHEVGHLIDGLYPGSSYHRLDPSKSPTKYGQRNANEAFAEAFTYWMFGLNLEPGARDAVIATLDQEGTATS